MGHLTRELLRSVAGGELPERALRELLLAHVAEVCASCRAEIAAFRAERASHEGPPRSHAGALRRARQDLRTLLRARHPERIELIKRARTRFRGALLADLLLEESRRLLRAPRELFELTQAAVEVIHISGDAPGRLALAWALQGNAFRIWADFEAARQRFRLVRRILAVHEVADFELLAEIDALEGRLFMDLREFARAETLMDRAIGFYTLAGAVEKTATPLISLGYLCHLRGAEGDAERAVALTERAAALLGPGSDPFLRLSVLHNLVLYLAEAGRFQEAEERLKAHLPLYRGQELGTRLRLAWLQAKIAAGLGRALAAERALLAVRAAYLKQGAGYDAALVSLEVAVLYLRQGRWPELRELARGLVPVFELHGIGREAMSAVELLVQALCAESVTVERLLALARRLRALQAQSPAPRP